MGAMTYALLMRRANNDGLDALATSASMQPEGLLTREQRTLADSLLRAGSYHRTAAIVAGISGGALALTGIAALIGSPPPRQESAAGCSPRPVAHRGRTAPPPPASNLFEGTMRTASSLVLPFGLVVLAACPVEQTYADLIPRSTAAPTRERERRPLGQRERRERPEQRQPEHADLAPRRFGRERGGRRVERVRPHDRSRAEHGSSELGHRRAVGRRGADTRRVAGTPDPVLAAGSSS